MEDDNFFEDVLPIAPVEIKKPQPKLTLGKVTKLSGMGFSDNERLLKIDDFSLSYFSKPPADMENVKSEIEKKTLKPKYSIPVSRIVKVEQLTEDDYKKIKRQSFQKGTDNFKVEFDKASLVKGSIDPDNADLDASKPAAKTDTWYFSVSKDEKSGATIADWLSSIGQIVHTANPNAVLSEQVQSAIKSATQPNGDQNERKEGHKTGFLWQTDKIPVPQPTVVKDQKRIDDKHKQEMDQLLDQNVNIASSLKNNTKDNTLSQQQKSNNHFQSQEKIDGFTKRINSYVSKQEEIDKYFRRKEDMGWDLKFQNFWSHITATSYRAQELKNNKKISELFFNHIGNFRKQAESVVVSIINEIHKKEKTYDTVDEIREGELYHTLMDDDWKDCKTLVYSAQDNTHQIIVKITSQGQTYRDQAYSEKEMDVTATQMHEQTMTINNPGSDPRNKERYWWKRFGKEFLSNDIMFDALFLNSKGDKQQCLRVPLSVMIDYKGFRAICIANIQIDCSVQPALGYFGGGTYNCEDDQLKQQMREVGDCLNLKVNKILKKGYSQQFEVIPVSSNIKIYQFQPQEEHTQNKADDDANLMKNWFTHHYHDLEYAKNPMYVLRTSEIFPYDCDVQERIPNTNRVLRPEFVCSYERPLKSDTRKPNKALASQVRDEITTISQSKKEASKDDEDQNDVMELGEASRVLRKSVIQQLVDLLDSLIVIPIDSQSLEQIFHIQGVNMRYLGLVTDLCQSPHIRDICLTEMASRTLKRMLNQTVSQNILEYQEEIDKTRNDIRELVEQEEKVKEQTVVYNAERNSHKINPEGTLDQIRARLEQLRAEERELHNDMEENVVSWTHDFMNLVFGVNTDDTKEYWDTVVLPEINQYYKHYSLEDLKAYKFNLNALYFSLCENIGLKSVHNESQAKLAHKKDKDKKTEYQEETFFKLFGKDHQPFGDYKKKEKYVFHYVPKCKTYQFRNLPYTLIANKFQEHKDNDEFKEALECCRMRSFMRSMLYGASQAKTSTNADLCQIFLETREYDSAIRFAMKSLDLMHPYHAASIKFYCILMQANYLLGKQMEADAFFSKALQALDHHWGPFHPLHISIYGIMAQLLIHNGKYDDASYLYQASLLCCMRVLGPNHIQTGEVHMDFGKLYLQKKEKQESLQHFIEAYLIYKSYFGTTALQTAEAALNIANIMEEQKRLKDALEYAKTAAQTYQNVYNKDNANTIKVLWQKLTIMYALEDPDTEREANYLLQVLAERDKLNPEHDQTVEDIKINVVATVYMQVTRCLKPEEKRLLKAFCDRLLFNKKLQEAKEKMEEIIPSLVDYHHKMIDKQLVSQVKKLSFPIKGREKLRKMYNESAKKTDEYPNGQTWLLYSYKKNLDQVKDKEEKRETLTNKKRELLRDQKLKETREKENLQNKALVLPGLEKSEITDAHQFSKEADDSENKEQYEFFLELIQTFEEINFYNLIMN